MEGWGTPVRRFTVDPAMFEPYEPWGEPVDRATAIRIATEGLANWRRINDESGADRRRQERIMGRKLSQEPDELRLRDHTLQPIQDLKFEGPFEVIGSCGHRVCYAALNPYPEHSGLIVLLAPHVDRSAPRGGALQLRGFDGRLVVLGTKEMIEDAIAHENYRICWAEAGEWGDPKARTWVIACPITGCLATHRVTNARLVEEFLNAIIDGCGEIRLSEPPKAQPIHAVRVADRDGKPTYRMKRRL